MKKKRVDEIIANCFKVEEHSLNDKGMYDGFWKGLAGFNREGVPREKSFWWVEDLVKDTLEKEKVFGDRPIILTRTLRGEDKFSLGSVFKGPVSTIDLWIFGYDLDNHSINNIWSIRTLEDNMKHEVWKNNKLFLIIVHCPNLGNKVSISVIDLYDKFSFMSPWDKEKTSKPRFHPNIRNVKVNVRAENCMVRFDDIPYQKYYERCHEVR